MVPTRIESVAKPPGQVRTPSEAVAFGRAQWQRKWRTFAAQWTQPQLMKLAQGAFRENALHSSQIFGFTSGKLRDPAPKVLTVIGKLNLAIAQANGEEVESEYRLPGTLAELYRGRRWMVTPGGKAMGPVEVFLALTGDLDLDNDGDLQINEENLKAVCKSLGKFLRFRLIDQGIDFMDPTEMERWGSDREVLERLLYGKVVQPADIDPFRLSEIAGCTEEELIDLAIEPAL